MLECIKELVRVDRDWVPEGKGYSLYIRPCMIATQVPFLTLLNDAAQTLMVNDRIPSELRPPARHFALYFYLPSVLTIVVVRSAVHHLW